ncbi:MAG: DUF368 domain-containing protein [Lachnospiraceae bacterium]|nr:DUF368 domain-containing protein [Butyrivibrio sp.]MCM1342219.1 DUF368 domain-containing protein [Muribaculaceae bacterium]MCM1409206.1 DUF368 domain-containing protein [Lachnospiraceae bacterium]
MIKSILKGMLIGIANIIPGVSGGTMMVSMGIYDKLIHCITHLFSEFKQSVRFLFPIAVGMGIAIIASAFGLEWLFESFPIQANLLFIGLILGSLPILWKNVKGSKIKIGHLIAGIAFFALVVGLAALGGTEGAAADLSFNLVNVLKLFVVGIIASATMVIPGVSGSMVLMLLGFYQPVLSAITDFIQALTSFDMDGILAGIGILAPFGIGVVAGIFAVAKVVEVIFEKFPLYAYWAIIGLVVASPVAIALMGGFAALSGMGAMMILHLLAGAVAFVAGFVVAMKLGE